MALGKDSVILPLSTAKGVLFQQLYQGLLS